MFGNLIQSIGALGFGGNSGSAGFAGGVGSGFAGILGSLSGGNPNGMNFQNGNQGLSNTGLLASGMTGFAGMGSLQGGVAQSGANGIGMPMGGPMFPQTNAQGGLIPRVLSPIIGLLSAIKSLIFLKRSVREMKPPNTSNIHTSYDAYRNYFQETATGEFDDNLDFPDPPGFTDQMNPDGQAAYL